MPGIAERDGLLNHGRDASGPGRRAAVVTASDTVDLPIYAKALYVGAAGNIRVLTVGGEDGGGRDLRQSSGRLVAGPGAARAGHRDHGDPGRGGVRLRPAVEAAVLAPGRGPGAGAAAVRCP
jgi:hypothetical protein